MSDADKKMGTPAPRRWLGPAFLASLVVNLFLVGLIASAIWMHREPPRSHGGQLPFLLGGDRAELSKEDRTALRQMMRGQFRTVLPDLMEMDKARTNLAKVIGETPYDAAKVSEAFLRVEQAQAKLAAITRQTKLEAFGKMSDLQRQRHAKVMEENAQHRWDRRKKRHGDGDDDHDHRSDDDSGPGPDRPSMP